MAVTEQHCVKAGRGRPRTCAWMADGGWEEQDAVSLLQALARPTALARPAPRGQPSQQVAQRPSAIQEETPVTVSKCWGQQLSPHLTRCNLDFTPGRNHFVRECDSNPRSGLCTDAPAA